MPAALRLAVAGLVIAASVAACAARANLHILEIPAQATAPVGTLEWVTDYPRALGTIAAILEEELELPPLHVRLHFYSDRAAFASGLMDSGYDEAFAWQTARSMDAIGGYRRVLLNEASLNRLSWTDRVALLAHELTHAVQYELGGGRRGTSDQWLREGYAEWMAWRVLERLGASSLDVQRRRSVREIVRNGRHLARLADLVTFRQWVYASSGPAAPPFYSQAFHAADFLIQRHGLAVVTAYFRLFAASDDRRANFSAAFDEDLETFEAAYRDHLSALLR